MQTMHEALAREHMRQLESEARRQRLVSEAAGHRRYLRTSARRARRAHPVARRSQSGTRPFAHSPVD